MKDTTKIAWRNFVSGLWSIILLPIAIPFALISRFGMWVNDEWDEYKDARKLEKKL